jgi:hypothetical protein
MNGRPPLGKRISSSGEETSFPGEDGSIPGKEVSFVKKELSQLHVVAHLARVEGGGEDALVLLGDLERLLDEAAALASEPRERAASDGSRRKSLTRRHSFPLPSRGICCSFQVTQIRAR